MKKNFIMIFLGVILLLVTFIFTTNQFNFFKEKINKQDKAVITTLVEEYRTYEDKQSRIDFCKNANREFLVSGGQSYSCFDYYEASKNETLSRYGIGSYIYYQHTIVEITSEEKTFTFNDSEVSYFEYTVISKYSTVEGGKVSTVTQTFYFVPHNNVRLFSLENQPRYWKIFN